MSYGTNLAEDVSRVDAEYHGLMSDTSAPATPAKSTSTGAILRAAAYTGIAVSAIAGVNYSVSKVSTPSAPGASTPSSDADLFSKFQGHQQAPSESQSIAATSHFIMEVVEPTPDEDQQGDTDASATTASFYVSNPDYGTNGGFGMYPWIKDRFIVEPYRTTTVAVDDLAVTRYGNISDYTWTVSLLGDSANTTESSGSKNSYEYVFTDVGTYSVHVTGTNADGEHLIHHMEQMLCRYVKRELRSLTDSDRDLFITAMSTIWKVSAGDGREAYGSGYTSVDEFVLHHAFQSSGDVYCDHWHEGAGFMTHHFALTMAMEVAVRSVNPMVTIPYWDFTVEGEAIFDVSGGPSMLSNLTDFFDENWFGATNDKHHISNGAWAHAKSPFAHPDAVKGLGPHIQNAYGIIRAPWNNNPEPELARAMFNICGEEPTNKAIPTCWDHWEVLTQEDLGQYLVMLPGAGHGPMHVNTGGVYGDCEGAFSKFYADHIIELSANMTVGKTVSSKHDVFKTKMHLELFHQYRTLWRSQICALDGQPFNLECPETCDLDTAEEDCMCKCAGVDDDDWDWKNIEPCMYASNGTKSLMHEWFSEEIRYDYTKMVCNLGIREGDNLESASPVDPIFWMIHPVLDRLTTAKRLATNSSIMYGQYGTIPAFTNETWVRMSIYDGYGPDGDDDYECYGHDATDSALGKPSDSFSLIDWVSERAGYDYDGDITNWEFYKYTNPAEFEAVDYVYDNFEWDHCIPHTGMDDELGPDSETEETLEGFDEEEEELVDATDSFRETKKRASKLQFDF